MERPRLEDTVPDANQDEFLKYFDRIRSRTRRVAALVPEDALEWAPKPGAMTPGDLIRHLAATERYMWAETVRGSASRYTTHGQELAQGCDAVLALFDCLHAESMAIFRALTPAQFEGPCVTPGGAPMPVWKWLRAMIEHEVHHRGQLYLLLSLRGIPTPPLFGMTSETLRAAAVEDPSS